MQPHEMGSRPAAGPVGQQKHAVGQHIECTDPRYLDGTPDAAEWRTRLAEQIWQHQRRKDAARALRRELAARRNHGLAARHAAKQRR